MLRSSCHLVCVCARRWSWCVRINNGFGCCIWEEWWVSCMSLVHCHFGAAPMEANDPTQSYMLQVGRGGASSLLAVTTLKCCGCSVGQPEAAQCC
jgi:hypothetical protein